MRHSREAFYSEELRRQCPLLRYGRCPACGSIWAADARRDAELLASVYAQLPSAYWAALNTSLGHIRTWDDLLHCHAPGRVLCDVGCGDGDVLVALSPRWEKHGLEPGRVAVGAARARGLDVRVGTPTSAGMLDSHDAITCIDVIEHVEDPAAELQAMGRMLRRGGVLLLVTGDAGAWSARLAGGWWEYLHCVGHISVLSRRALREAALAAELEIVRHDPVQHHAGVSTPRWLHDMYRNWRRTRRGGRARPIGYLRDHQLLLARRR